MGCSKHDGEGLLDGVSAQGSPGHGHSAPLGKGIAECVRKKLDGSRMVNGRKQNQKQSMVVDTITSTKGKDNLKTALKRSPSGE